MLRPLTRRQRELAQLIRQGKTNAECAAAMGTSVGTVKVYANRLFFKCAVRNRAQMAVWATEHPEALVPKEQDAEAA